MEFKKSNNVDNGTTKKRIIDFELYGVIAICKSFKKCSKEVFKHALYNNKRLHLMALKKVSIKFANRIYYCFKRYETEG